MDSTMLLMDVISAACAAYCAYTWVRPVSYTHLTLPTNSYV